MKKILTTLVIVVVAVQIAWSQSPGVKEPPKLGDISEHFRNIPGDPDGKFVYSFGGFDFVNYKNGDPSLTALNKLEIDFIKQDTKRLPRSDGGRYSIIGHSQGGLRALGYISQLEKNGGDPNTIDAVITTSAIDQGLPMLDGGLGAFKARAGQKINIVGNGLRAIRGIFDFFNVLGFLGVDHIIPRNGLAEMTHGALDFILKILPGEMRPYWAQAWVSTVAPPQIRDMIPRSGYIQENVVETIDHTVKLPAGFKRVTEWRYHKVWGLKIWYLSTRMEPVYVYFKIPEAKPKFDSKVPVGFIAGVNPNTLSMSENEDNIRTAINAAGSAFEFAEFTHTAKCALIFGLFMNSPTYAADAAKASRLMYNIDFELNDLKRSRENDGLVALSGQYIPRTFRDPNTGAIRTTMKNPVLGNTREGYQPVWLTHNDAHPTHPEVLKYSSQWIIDAEKERVRQGLR